MKSKHSKWEMPEDYCASNIYASIRYEHMPVHIAVCTPFWVVSFSSMGRFFESYCFMWVHNRLPYDSSTFKNRPGMCRGTGLIVVCNLTRASKCIQNEDENLHNSDLPHYIGKFHSFLCRSSFCTVSQQFLRVSLFLFLEMLCHVLPHA